MTTAGFRDVLLIGRQKRYETYDLYMDKPAPLVARRNVFEVIERVGPNGEVDKELEPRITRCHHRNARRKHYSIRGSVALSCLRQSDPRKHNKENPSGSIAQLTGIAVIGHFS
ncbi:MAG: hypothetical protein CM1200mP41_12410 [Gammaproteobacteria bacterium]|nr:MAG: hypothetical protein CM1200mP41_12410 [Gammaproteobacteria bacterium]